MKAMSKTVMMLMAMLLPTQCASGFSAHSMTQQQQQLMFSTATELSTATTLQTSILKEKVRYHQERNACSIRELDGSIGWMEFLESTTDNEKEHTSTTTTRVVLIYSKWCKSCQNVLLKYKKLAATSSNNVLLAQMEYGKHAAFCQSHLGVTKLPSVYFYNAHGDELASFSCGPSQFGLVEQALIQFDTTTQTSGTRELNDSLE
jgi:hypothetical protein